MRRVEFLHTDIAVLVITAVRSKAYTSPLFMFFKTKNLATLLRMNNEYQTFSRLIYICYFCVQISN